ncbi:hypothetical protein [Streptomyces kurssanovii]|uniref:Uncharacterized protein n=1 Tax=Streptomyces kurssanovii TaxID=67312 RepID=A0ABV3HTK6_9ACTN
MRRTRDHDASAVPAREVPEAAYAGSFTVQVSDDPGSGTSRELHATTSSAGGAQRPAVAGQGRRVRLLVRTRATPCGVSRHEFQAHEFQVHEFQVHGR